MTGDLHWLNQRLFPYSLHTPRTLFSTSEKMIYERGCQEKQLPDGRPDGHFCRDSQPLYRYVKPWFRQSAAKSYIFKTVDSETEQQMGSMKGDVKRNSSPMAGQADTFVVTASPSTVM